MIIGTAGHVDHGKTALVERLTGIDTDRLKEEKARGLTIEAGFAYPELEDDGELGFVDVPGHEKFIHNMLAGSAGIDTVLLVVAADDGVMPQTVEHVQILQLLGLSRGWVAMTKTDLVDDVRCAEVEREIETLLDATPLAGMPVYRVSSYSGEGIEALRATLWQQAAEASRSPARGAFRLAVDRVFSKTGAGLVVTGTALSGMVAKGDSVRLVGSGKPARVRSLRRQHRDSDYAWQGDRVALNLAGAGIEREATARGDWIVDESLVTPELTRLDVHVELLNGAPIVRHWTPVHIHLGVAHVTGRLSLLEGQRLSPGEGMLGQLVLDRPVHACLGDRAVIRDHGAHLTLGGATVLDGDPPRRGQRAPKRLAWLSTLADAVANGPPYDLERPLKAALELKSDGLALDTMARTVNVPLETLSEQVEALGGRVITQQGQSRAFSRQAVEALEQRVIETVEANHAREPSMLGTERERLGRQAMPGLPSLFFRPLLNTLIESGRLEQHGPFVSLPGHRVALDANDEALWLRLEPLLAAQPFQPPRVRDLATGEGLDEQRVRQALMACARLGKVYQVRKDHFYLASAIHDMARIVEALAEEKGAARAADFRDRIGTGRKLAIQILEFFDRLGFTRRVRDDHLLRREALWS
ncbi:selenocysteine-specific translation elongation factor [Litchfieldella xinjiangensis]|uniref:selenocysteine-specific translation elongation factor n=1 Tax=Litchfieldella xinjiangensis TaxID=1166948 RepID=UPI0005B7CD0A|nr:selenocysteine-specific translation elongation factor [Halomonas xinjiangensis]